jgi:hypothetical protein
MAGTETEGRLTRPKGLWRKSQPTSRATHHPPADFNRNRRPTSIGMGGRHQLECPAEISGIRIAEGQRAQGSQRHRDRVLPVRILVLPLHLRARGRQRSRGRALSRGPPAHRWVLFRAFRRLAFRRGSRAPGPHRSTPSSGIARKARKRTRRWPGRARLRDRAAASRRLRPASRIARA